MNHLQKLFVCLLWPALALAARGQTETAIWSDNFETNAASSWTSTPTGVWRIGSPSAGPALDSAGCRAHTGAKCAYTQGYKINTDSRLICTNYNGSSTLDIPDADQNPRLRFWHWFNFAYAAGFVEISTDGGNTWDQLSQTYTYSGTPTSSGVWSRPYIDLSAYAGQSVQFAFRFYGAGSGNNLGWYIDDVEVVTSDDSPTLNFPESFEFDPKTSDWSVENGTWEIGKPTSGPMAAHTGTNCAATVLGGNYANYVDSRLISPPFTLPNNSAILQFWHWYNFGNNGLGFLEINNGFTTTTTVTNTTIATNGSGMLDTNVYQLSNAANTNYAPPFYWNPAIGGWTNINKKVLGNVFDFSSGFYHFEGGTAPLSTIGPGNQDYRGAILPVPQSVTATNFSVWQGMTWNSAVNGNDNPVGYFGTNFTTIYTTNTTITTSETSWNQVSATFQFGSTLGKWIQESIDLSAYAGQTVQLAFRFGSGGNTPTAGWYVDDISLLSAPDFTVPTNQVISYGQVFTNQLTATNTRASNSIFKFALAAASTNVVVYTNGLLIWTNVAAPPGTYVVSVKVTDNQSPPFSVTNSFSVTVQALPSQLTLTNVVVGTNNFKFSITTPWKNNSFTIMATTNLDGGSTNWLPIYTNKTGSSGMLLFTDLLSTNYLQRYYRAVFQ